VENKTKKGILRKIKNKRSRRLETGKRRNQDSGGMQKLDGGALLPRKTWDAGNSQKKKTNVLGKNREEN
jgi:hypothetical protein